MLWKDVKNYEGLYQVSDTGLIRSFPRRGTRSRKPELRKISLDGSGYPQITLCKHGKQKSFKIHKLVAKAFLENPLGFTEINHIDENKLNNDVKNLEWCDRLYNVNYGLRTEKTKKAVIQMTLEGVELAEHKSIKEAAICIGSKTFGGISNACYGKAKSAYGYKWKFKEVI